MRLMQRVGIGLAMMGVPALAASTQDRPVAMGPAQVVVSAWDEVEVAPDRARLQVTIETRGRAPQAASSENARAATAVLDALRRAGISGPRIRTQGLVVAPEYEYPREGGRPTVVGYQARNVLSVDVHDLSQLGAALDAVVGAGATTVTGPEFYLSNPDSARRVALASAVRRARADATVMADAAGVSIGEVLELTTGGQPEAPMFRMAEMSAARAGGIAETPVLPGLVRIRADVTLRLAVVSRQP